MFLKDVHWSSQEELSHSRTNPSQKHRGNSVKMNIKDGKLYGIIKCIIPDLHFLSIVRIYECVYDTCEYDASELFMFSPQDPII